RWRKTETLKQQRPAITLDRSDRRQDRLSRRIQNRVVVRIQNRRRPATERECPCKILRRDIVIRRVVDPHSQSPAVLSTNGRYVVRKLEMLLRIHDMSGGRRAAVKRTKHLEGVTRRVWSDLAMRMVNLKPDLVHDARG